MGTVNQMTVHSVAGCKIKENMSKQALGKVLHTNCDVSGSDNLGCGVADPSSSSLGKAFNDNGGGVFVMEWKKYGIFGVSAALKYPKSSSRVKTPNQPIGLCHQSLIGIKMTVKISVKGSLSIKLSLTSLCAEIGPVPRLFIMQTVCVRELVLQPSPTLPTSKMHIGRCSDAVVFRARLDPLYDAARGFQLYLLNFYFFSLRAEKGHFYLENTMEVQSLAVRSYQVITPTDSTKPYVLYSIEIRTKLKSFTIHRRYSDFERLYNALKMELDAAVARRSLPCLPPKSMSFVGYLTGSSSLINQPSKLADRQAGLERWLKKVIVHKELKDVTSRSTALLQFLELASMPNLSSSLATPSSASPSNPFTSQSWLAEHHEIRDSVREIYDMISRRDELVQASTSTSSTLIEVNRINLDAKRTLLNVTARLSALAESLKLFSQPTGPKGTKTLTEGECSRRMQLISTLQDDCERLNKMTISNRAELGGGIRQTNQILSSEAASRDRTELLGSHTSNSTGGRRTTRVLGAPGPHAGNIPAEETNETRHLENRQLIDHQLHHVIGQKQEAKLKSLTEILSRQKQIGLMINQELTEQNEIIDDLDRDVDSATRKLKDARKKIDRLT